MRGVNVNMFYDDLNTEEQVSYLIKPILQVLQEAGGQLERSEIILKDMPCGYYAERKAQDDEWSVRKR